MTGDYSRGASGFLIENGEVTSPVSEITIAGNLRDMFARLEPANDLDKRFGTNAPTVLDRRYDHCGTLSRNAADLDLLTGLANEAGKIAMKWFREDPEVWMKEGNSPVSEADFAVDKFLKEQLLAARPDYGWLSEETDDDLERLRAGRTFVVDPIDGTRGFINGMKQWCISIAVVEDNRPVAGVLECPVLKQTIAASANGGAVLNGKPVIVGGTADAAVIRVTGPRSLQTAVGDFSDLNMERMPFVPSLAYRLAMMAMGEIDLALARSSAKDWDLAAADLIVHEAGGLLTDLEGDTLRYNCRDIRHGTLVASRAAGHHEMLDLARRAMDKTQR